MTVAVLMGSDSDYPVMSGAVDVLDEFEVPTDVQVLSAHRMPHQMLEFGTDAADNGIKVIIAGAGGAAHLPGMLASVTDLPVIGVPVRLENLEGLDSLLSIVQMPKGVPVATVAINNATNAGLLALKILGVGDPEMRAKLTDHRENLREESQAKNTNLPHRRAPFGFSIPTAE